MSRNVLSMVLWPALSCLVACGVPGATTPDAQGVDVVRNDDATLDTGGPLTTDAPTATDARIDDRSVAPVDSGLARDTGVAADGAPDVAVVTGGGTDSCSATPPCDPIGQTGCPAGQGCYLDFGGSDGFTYTGVRCMTTGTHGDSESCTTNNDCRPGYTCLIGLICMKVCDPARGRASSPECAGERSGSDCSFDTDPTACFGLCQDGTSGT